MTDYEAACAAHDEAIAIFNTARDKFRGLPGIASDADYAEFAAAQAAFKDATSVFDAAYEIASNIPEDTGEITSDYEDTQMALFA